ncbi:MAG: DUF1028 domain-containing protein [Kiloniellaceae bacterium]
MVVVLNTFSIAACCPRSGALGIAISTALPAVGGYCSFIEPGVGAVATQSWTNPYLAIDALAGLAGGATATEALQRVLDADSDADLRQVGVVDADGGTAAWTGAACTDWAGHVAGEGFTVQGNMLVGAETIDVMVAVMDATRDRELADRLVTALLAGQQAGGDKRGKQSAALKIYGAEAYPLLDLRVDDHSDPVTELARLHDLAKVQLQPFLDSLPRRKKGQAVPLSDAAKAVIMLPPDRRPRDTGEKA